MDSIDFLRYDSQTYTQNNAKKKKNAACEEFNGNMKQRSQANARERDRTHRERRCLAEPTSKKTALTHVNSAFTTLRTLIPTEPKDRKLSKIETLRLASSYISHLGSQLMAGPVDQPCLRISKEIEADSANRHQQSVCTFCIAHKKSSNRTTAIEEYACPNSMDNQLYYTQQIYMINNADLTNLYY